MTLLLLFNSIAGAALASPVGIEATGAVGIATASGGSSLPAVATPQGVEALAQVGVISFAQTLPIGGGGLVPRLTRADGTATPAGVKADGWLGHIEASGTLLPDILPFQSDIIQALADMPAKDGHATPEGVHVQVGVRAPSTASNSHVSPGGTGAAALVGNVVAFARALVVPKGADAVALAGTPSAAGHALVVPLGVEALAAAGSPGASSASAPLEDDSEEIAIALLLLLEAA